MTRSASLLSNHAYVRETDGHMGCAHLTRRLAPRLGPGRQSRLPDDTSFLASIITWGSPAPHVVQASMRSHARYVAGTAPRGSFRGRLLPIKPGTSPARFKNTEAVFTFSSGYLATWRDSISDWPGRTLPMLFTRAYSRLPLSGADFVSTHGDASR